MRAAPHATHGLIENLHDSENRLQAQRLGARLDCRHFRWRDVEQQISRAADQTRQHVAIVTDKLLRELPDIDPFADGGVDLGQCCRCIAANRGLNQRRQSARLGGAEHGVNVFDRDSLAA